MLRSQIRLGRVFGINAGDYPDVHLGELIVFNYARGLSLGDAAGGGGGHG